MNQHCFSVGGFRLPGCAQALTLLGTSLCALACGNRYEIGDIVAKQAQPGADGASTVQMAAAPVSAVPRTIIADAYDVDATAQEPDPTNMDRQTIIVPLGDVNGDGHADWADNAQIVYGTPRPQSGEVIAPARTSFDLPVGEAFAQENLPGLTVGSPYVCGAAAGDVNGDGYADVFFNSKVNVQNGDVSSPPLASAGTRWDAPYAFLVLGGPARALGPQPPPTAALAFNDRDGLASHFTAELESASRKGSATQFVALTALGDLDGDGFDDFCVTTTFSYDEFLAGPDSPGARAALEQRSESTTYLIYGSHSPERSTDPAARLPGIVNSFRAGDVNGDGFGDVLFVGTDRAYLWPGGSVHPSGDLNLELAAVPLEGIAADFLSVGGFLERVGDLDHDGYDDFILADQGVDADGSSRVHYLLFYGRADLFSGPLRVDAADAVFDDGVPNAMFEYGVPSSYSGKMSRAGDLNADGFDDLLIQHSLWAPGDSSPNASVEETLILPGTAQRWTGMITVPSQRQGLQPIASESSFATYYVPQPAGDLDGDGFEDLLLRRVLPGPILGGPWLTDTSIKYGGPLPALPTQIH